jgi:hypothetical protein
VRVKGQSRFPTGPDDWVWFSANVPQKLRELAQGGHQIVVFSNQGGIKGAWTGKAAQNCKQVGAGDACCCLELCVCDGSSLLRGAECV